MAENVWNLNDSPLVPVAFTAVPPQWVETYWGPGIVTSDMTTLDYTVAASADDASEDSTGGINLTGNPLLNCDGANEWNAWRFLAVTIPAGATINVAYLTVQMTSSTLDEPDVTIYGEDISLPLTYAVVLNNISLRLRTTATVNWSNTNAGVVDVNTADLSTIVQELVNSYDYSSGLNMAFMWTSRAADATRDTSVTSYDASTTICARLHIEYTAAGGGSIIPILQRQYRERRN